MEDGRGWGTAEVAEDSAATEREGSQNRDAH